MNGGKNQSSDTSGVCNEGSAKPLPVASEWVKSPGNAYGGGPSGMQPGKARTHSYTPDASSKKR